MRKNRTISSLFILLVGLLMIATSSFLAAQEKSNPPEITQVTITTSGRADYRYFTLENPPRLVIHFESRNVFNSLFEDRQEFPEGILVSMEAQYYPKPEGLPAAPAAQAGHPRAPLRALILTLRSPTTYQVIEEENAIEVILKDTSLVTKEEGVPTELAITRVVSGPKDLSEEQHALIDTFALVKARQMTEAVQPAVQSQRPRSEMAYGWLLLLILIGFIGFVLRVLFMRGGRGKKENLSVAKMIANLGELQEKLTEQEGQAKTELDTERAGKEKITQELETLRKGCAALEKEKQELTQRLELQHQQETVSHREFEEKLSGAYAKIEQTQMELTTERAEKEKVLTDLKTLREDLIRVRVEAHAEAVVPQKSPGGTVQPAQKEHREFPRIQLKKNRILIRVQDSSQNSRQFFNSEVLNLSTGGLCTKGQTHCKFPQQSQFRLFFFGNPHPIHGIARKIWERKETPRQTLVGIAFDSISGQDRDRIRQHVERKTGV